MTTAETLLPPGTLVWQMPYQTFPETGAVFDGELRVVSRLPPLEGVAMELWRNERARGGSWIPGSGGSSDRRAGRSCGAQRIRRGLHRPAWLRRFGRRRRSQAAREARRRRSCKAAMARSRCIDCNPVGSRPLPLEEVSQPFDTPIRFDAPALSGLLSQSRRPVGLGAVGTLVGRADDAPPAIAKPAAALCASHRDGHGALAECGRRPDRAGGRRAASVQGGFRRDRGRDSVRPCRLPPGRSNSSSPIPAHRSSSA